MKNKLTEKMKDSQIYPLIFVAKILLFSFMIILHYAYNIVSR